eukprot:6638337-Lingulodinium_polyedra.AAC.1
MTTQPSSTSSRCNGRGAERTKAVLPNVTSMRLAGGVHRNLRRTFNVLPIQPLRSWRGFSRTTRSALRLECRAGPLRAKG